MSTIQLLTLLLGMNRQTVCLPFANFGASTSQESNGMFMSSNSQMALLRIGRILLFLQKTGFGNRKEKSTCTSLRNGVTSNFLQVLRYNGSPKPRLDSVNATELEKDPEWPIRDSLMQTYYALYNYASKHNHIYTDDLRLLVNAGMFLSTCNLILSGLPKYVAEGLCSSVPKITLTDGGRRFRVESHVGSLKGYITEERTILFN